MIFYVLTSGGPPEGVVVTQAKFYACYCLLQYFLCGPRMHNGCIHVKAKSCALTACDLPY